MGTVGAQLEAQKYVYLPGLLAADRCANLTEEMKSNIAQGFSFYDPQCPRSHALPTLPAFDSLLLELLPKFEKLSGKKLLPTYSYARFYLPGEELKNHIDRAACEISATVTLGFDGDVWPIYMGDDMAKTNPIEIHMQIGDAVLYRGIEKHHWREVYTEGKWQAQVFLHYVDADGPHKDWVYDRRGGLNLPNTQ